MKLFTIILTVIIAIAIKINAQIPNNGFENWTTIGSCLQPNGWAGINDWLGSTENCYSISRSTDHYPVSVGSYSIKIENMVSIFPDMGAYGLAWTGDSTGYGMDNPVFPVIHPTSLHGYYKYIPQNDETMSIFILLYKNGVEVSQAEFNTNTASDWTAFNLPIPAYIDADSARLRLSSCSADNIGVVPDGNSVLYVDNLSFDALIISVPEQVVINPLFSLYPNPAYDIVTLNSYNTNNADLTLNIYDIIGTLVKSETLKQNNRQINIRDLSKGVYLVKIKSKEYTENQKLIIQR